VRIEEMSMMTSTTTPASATVDTTDRHVYLPSVCGNDTLWVRTYVTTVYLAQHSDDMYSGTTAGRFWAAVVVPSTLANIIPGPCVHEIRYIELKNRIVSYKQCVLMFRCGYNCDSTSIKRRTAVESRRVRLNRSRIVVVTSTWECSLYLTY